MDCSNEEKDALNDETFGHAEIGDWELEHERFVLENEGFDSDAPNADALPRFWESPDDFSFTWEPGSLDTFQKFFDDDREEMGVNVEETLQKLVSDEDTFEDPAILDISRKGSSRETYNSALEQILGTPSYPYGPSGILNGSHDIWSSNGVAESFSNGSFPKNSAAASTSEVHRFMQTMPSEPKSQTGIPLSIGDLLKCAEQTNKPKIESVAQASPVRSNSQPMFNLPVLNPSYHHLWPGTKLGTATLSPSIQGHTPVPWQFSRTGCTQTMRPLVSSNPADLISYLQLYAARNAGTKLRTPQPTLPNMNVLQFLSLSGRLGGVSMPAPQPIGFPRLPTLAIPTQPHSVLPLPRHPSTQFMLSPGNNLSRSTNAPSRSKDAAQAFPNSADKQEIFDPDIGSWMTHYESVGVLLMYLRPLIVSNPYIQDYYFAVRWLRQMYASHSKQQPAAGPPPVMYMPSPLTMENLVDPSHHHHVALSHKLVVPLVSMSHSTSKVVDNSVAAEDSSPDKSRSDQPSSPAKDSICTLGRSTRSNVNRPRVLSDLSVSSALAMGPNETSMDNSRAGENPPAARSVCAVKSSRLNRLLLARIERMYTLVLHIDEVDISLSRVVVQNEIRFRLVGHRQALIEKLVRELLHTSTQAVTAADNTSSTVTGDSDISVAFAELLGIRKGLRLFSTVLYYLSPPLLRVCLRDFVRQFDRLHHLWAPFTSDCATIFYPSLRHAIYQLNDISTFMATCFPEVSHQPLTESTSQTLPTVRAMILSKLGFSLILCLLDTCARLSRPDEPMCFIKNAAYFIHLTTCLINSPDSDGSSSIIEPYEAFPHLASIIPVYVKPEAHEPLTSEEINHFCSLIRCQPPAGQSNSPGVTAITTSLAETAISSPSAGSTAIIAS